MIPRSILALLAIAAITSNLGATVLTVGPDGIFSTLQGAIDAAIVAGGEQEIRVQAGTYQENLNVSPLAFAGSITILGGWNSGFSSRSPHAESTIIDGTQSGRPLTIEITGGEIQFDSMTLTGGLVGDTLPFGGGLNVQLSGDAVIRMDGCRISENTVASPSQAWGGGVSVGLEGTSELHLNRVSVLENTADCGSGGGGAGGLYIVASDSSAVTISSTVVDRNTVRTSNVSALIQYGGLAVFGDDQSVVIIEDTQVRANTLGGSANVWVSGAQLGGGQSLVVQRCRFIDNQAPSNNGVYQTLVAHGRITDSVIAGGNANGILLGSSNTSVTATNLTVANAPGIGIELNVGTDSDVSLFNSAIFGNTVDLEVLPGSTGLLEMDFNLIGIDPGFVDPEGRDYHLRMGSVAENAGTNTPPGDLGPFDCDKGPRVIDSVADIGAFEGISEVFSDGFESATTQFWSRVFPDSMERAFRAKSHIRRGFESEVRRSPNTSFQRTPTRAGCGPLNSDR